MMRRSPSHHHHHHHLFAHPFSPDGLTVTSSDMRGVPSTGFENGKNVGVGKTLHVLTFLPLCTNKLMNKEVCVLRRTSGYWSLQARLVKSEEETRK
ncbi:hypothetical protein O3P69_000431 [Scylla paramamosain]|uniref:Uncharacterized protein n=1 Tax=Scylla paramamosain TaxID=85552 RepID=A0AAW0UWA8_SCYPA